jgi:hypothetical protein
MAAYTNPEIQAIRVRDIEDRWKLILASLDSAPPKPPESEVKHV